MFVACLGDGAKLQEVPVQLVLVCVEVQVAAVYLAAVVARCHVTGGVDAFRTEWRRGLAHGDLCY